MIPGIVASQILASVDGAEPAPPPVITSSDTATVNEGSALAKSLTADQTVTWSIIGGVDAAEFELFGSTLRFASNSVKDYEAPDDDNADNAYLVEIRATSSSGTDEQTIIVTVNDVAAPTITSSNTASVADEVQLSKTLTANQTVTWSIVGGADAADFEISGSTLRWASNGTRDFENPEDADLDNDYIVDVRATNSSTNDTSDQTITVSVVATLPAFIVIVAGQSNARAFDTTGSDVPVALQGTDSQIKIWNTHTDTWQDYEAGVNSDTYNSGATTPQKWGPEAGFVKAYLSANPSDDIFVVKVTKDSAILTSRVGDDWSPSSSGDLYDITTGVIDDAKAALVGMGRTPDVVALLWMQGEHDALDSTFGTNYGVNLSGFITDVRTDWGDSGTQVILGRITPSIQWNTAGSPVRAFQARVARDTSDTQAIDTDSYTLAADGKHYVAASVQALGEDMFDAYDGAYTLLPVRFGTMLADKDSDIVLTNGNLTAEGGGTNSSDLQTVRCDQVPSGKVYMEFLIDAQTANLSIGLGKGVATNSFWGSVSDSIGYVRSGAVFKNNTQIATYSTYTAGDRIMMAFDSATGEVWFGKNGTWNGDPAAGTGEAATMSATTTTSYHRFGTTLRRSGDKVTLKLTAADFAHSVPSGFSAL